MDLQLKDKTALVTGATGGIGEAIATALHKQGATVAITGRREAELNRVTDRAYALVGGNVARVTPPVPPEPVTGPVPPGGALKRCSISGAPYDSRLLWH